MDKNVSGVDLEELMKAREELDKEKGVETDPNMYSDYNPNRNSENSEKSAELNENYQDITNLENSNSDLNQTGEASSNENSSDIFGKLDAASSDTETENNTLSSDDTISNNDNYFEHENNEATRNEDFDAVNDENSNDEHSSEENFSKFNAFSAFEVKENASIHTDNENNEEKPKVEGVSLDEINALRAEEKAEENQLNGSSTNNVQQIEEKLKSESSNELPQTENSDTPELDKKLESIDNANDLESMLDDLLNSIDDEMENDEKTDEDTNLKAEGQESSEAEEKVNEPENENIDNESTSMPSIDVEPKFETDKETESKEENDLSDIISSLTLDDLMDFDDSENKEESEQSSDEKDEESGEENEKSAQDNDEKDDINFDNVSDNSTILNVNELNEDSSKTDEIEEISKPEPVEEKPVEQPKQVSVENEKSGDTTEIITDYNQLKQILQKELKESEQAEQEKVDDASAQKEFESKFKKIEEFKFINEIASDGFKNSDKFSYILGRNEKDEMVYGNFKQHFNLAVFGKNDEVVNSFLNSMILSLCLKNSYHDINFVLLDSNIDSSFEVYNKSSYLYFNRIAKTNKEILDTLIEVSKEIDNRYDKLAGLGVKNIEKYNEACIEGGLTVMPYIVVVFNNYTSASQATDSDRINACLYQILKFGRIAGVYAVVTAKLPIETSQINYSLSSRLSFKSDEDSRYTVGVQGAESLPDESDAIYFNISSNETQHVKTATVTDTELDLIIKDLED